jgi:5-methylcytosine-specific restriction endonuclease McrA
MTSKWGGRRVAALRAAWQPLIDEGGILCPFCSLPIRPGQAWDLDHRIPKVIAPEAIWDESNHRPAHASCNRRHGAVLGNRSRKRRASRRRRTSPRAATPAAAAQPTPAQWWNHWR